MQLGEFKSLLRFTLVGAIATATVFNFGCSPFAGTEDYLGKSFLNPSEMMRLTHNQLTLPILDKLSGLDEPNEEFSLARNVIADDLKVESSDYIVGRSDLVQIGLVDVTPGIETSKTVRVSESGNITLPLVGQVPAAGFTERQLELEIAKKYKDSGIVIAAQVSVQVVEARSRTFQVRGAVSRPGQYAIVQSDFRMIDALILAGDPVIPTIEHAYIIRKTVNTATIKAMSADEKGAPDKVNPAPGTGDLLAPKPKVDKGLIPAEKTEGATPLTPADTVKEPVKPLTEEKPAPIFVNGGEKTPDGDKAAEMGAKKATDKATEKTDKFEFNSALPEDTSVVIRIPLRQLIKGDMKYNVVIRPQDTLVIPTPESGEYYMGGHVQREGVYSLTARDITLKQAIISAGGLDEIAIPERTDIIRRIGRDKEVYVRINLIKVFEGKQPDIFLKPYDIVMVGTNAVAPFIAAVRNGFRITYGFGFLYDRNFYLDPSQASGRQRSNTR